MRTRVVIVPAASEDIEYSQILEKRLIFLGFQTWSLETQTKIGESILGNIDKALRDAIALILIRSKASIQSQWSLIQQRAFQSQIRFSGALKLIVVPRTRILLAPSLLSQAVVLEPQSDPYLAALACASIISNNPSSSSFQLLSHPDSPNALIYNPEAYTQVNPLESKFEKYVNVIMSLSSLKEYEPANELYWKILYYTGYRELWETRLTLSNRLLRLSLDLNDHITAGLVLTKGVGYAFMEQNNYRDAVNYYQRAFKHFQMEKYKRGMGICWDYLGDIFEKQNRINDAISAYNQASSLYDGLEQHVVRLKQEFISVRFKNNKPSDWLVNFQRIHEEFLKINDYRVALSEYEIIKILYQLKEPNLYNRTKQLYSLVNETIKMPRITKKINALIQLIQAKNT